jgi:hypothetical protein
MSAVAASGAAMMMDKTRQHLFPYKTNPVHISPGELHVLDLLLLLDGSPITASRHFYSPQCLRRTIKKKLVKHAGRATALS